MNERIRELAEQTKKYALDAMIKITDKEQALKVYSETYDTKFAELIVAECTEQVWYTREDDINGNISEVIKERMKQHFGVEE